MKIIVIKTINSDTVHDYNNNSENSRKKKLIIDNECHNNKKYNNIHKKIINFSGFHLLDYWLAKNVHSFSLEDYSNPVQQYEKKYSEEWKSVRLERWKIQVHFHFKVSIWKQFT